MIKFNLHKFSGICYTVKQTGTVSGNAERISQVATGMISGTIEIMVKINW